MSFERAVPVPTIVEGDPSPSYAACPFCFTPAADAATEEPFVCSLCREVVQPIQLPDEPDPVAEAPVEVYLTRVVRGVLPSALVTRETTEQGWARYVLTVSNAVRVILGRDFTTARVALGGWIAAFERSEQRVAAVYANLQGA